jgi:sigma-E factor negative regulatory protein RseA
MKEKLSAFVDNELSEHEQSQLLRALAEDPELDRTWERYHLMRAVMRNELEMMVAPDTAMRVMQQLHDMPELPVVKDASNHRRLPIVKIVSGLAIAASVAALAIFGVQTLSVEQSNSSLTTASAPPQDFIRTNVIRWDTNRPEQEDALNAFLVEHNEFTPTSGMGGIMSYVRVVGYHQHE